MLVFICSKFPLSSKTAPPPSPLSSRDEHDVESWIPVWLMKGGYQWTLKILEIDTDFS